MPQRESSWTETDGDGALEGGRDTGWVLDGRRYEDAGVAEVNYSVVCSTAAKGFKIALLTLAFAVALALAKGPTHGTREA